MSMVSKQLKSSQSGDTLIEVLLATVILSIIMVGAYTLSNRASNINQQSYDRSRASSVVQQQAELVRSVRDSYVASLPPGTQEWDQVKTYAQSRGSLSDLGTDCNDFSTLSANRGAANVFHLDSAGSVVNSIATVDSFYRVWVEAEVGSTPDLYDFHVFACWEAAGVSQIQKTKVVLRLEENDA